MWGTKLGSLRMFKTNCFHDVLMRFSSYMYGILIRLVDSSYLVLHSGSLCVFLTVCIVLPSWNFCRSLLLHSLSPSLSRRYTPSLPRREVTQVDTLREEWDALTQLADTTQHHLLHEQRHIHERETEKQVSLWIHVV